MKRRLILSAALGAGLAVILAIAASGEVFRAGNLFVKDTGGISPKTLPRHEQAPISAFLRAELGTVDGSHPPAARTLLIDFDRTLHLNATGLPVCREGQLMSRSTGEVKRACGDAIVGSGEGEVEVAFPEQKPIHASGPILLVNGGVHGGKTLLFAHTYVNIPAPTAVVARVEITRIHRGHFGMHSVTEIPRIAGGAGSVTKVRLRIGRRFTYKGERQSFLTASCPTGTYYTEGDALFSDGTRLHITHALPCTPTR